MSYYINPFQFNLTYQYIHNTLMHRRPSLKHLQITMQSMDQAVTVNFSISKQVEFGQVLVIVGSVFGDWRTENGLEMQWTEGHVWRASATFQKSIVDYKYVVINQDDRSIVEWEQGPNRSLETYKDTILQQTDHWNLRKVRVKLFAHTDSTFKLNFLRIHQNVTMLPSNNVIQNPQKDQCYKVSFFMDVEQLFKGTVYLYSDSNDKWERGGSRKLSLVTTVNDKGGTQIINNVVCKTDRNLDFALSLSKINDRIKVGSYIWDESDINQLQQMKVTAVLNLQTDEDLARRGQDPMKFQQINQLCQDRNILYIRYSIIDQCDEDFFQKGLKAQALLKSLIDSGRRVYVHCTAGIQRSVQTVLLYLVLHQHQSLQSAIQTLKSKRPQSKPNQHLLQRQIERFYHQHNTTRFQEARSRVTNC